MSHRVDTLLKRASVSVVIPCYRCANTIDRAVSSVINQTLPPEEIILVEDCSNDSDLTRSTLEIISSKYSTANIKIYYLEKNLGPGSARNVGWEACSQPYVAFLDADDSWHPEKLEVQFGWMLNNPQFGLTGHGCSATGGFDIQPISSRTVTPVRKFNSLFSNPFATRTVMLKRNLPFRFIEGKRYAEDYKLWLDIILADIPAGFIDTLLASAFKNDYGSSGLSANLWRMEKGELNTYWLIYKSNKISFLMLVIISLYSLIKYLKRVLVTSIRKYI